MDKDKIIAAAYASRFVKRTLPDGSIRAQIEKDFALEVTKSDGIYTVAVSDDTMDRYRDVVEPKGCNFENYSKNPVWLVDHNYRVESIVGRGINGRVAQKRVMLDFTPDPINSSAATDMVLAKLDSGSLRAVSVGFLPTKWEKILDDKNEWTGGFRYLKWELLEVSWVAVPANPNALLLAAEAGEGLAIPSPETSGHGDATLDKQQADMGALTQAAVDLFVTAHRRN